MHLFTDYIEPLITWLYSHPHWALLITFFVSLSESLAIVGSIIPGSVTMTAIGILAGSGVMRIDLTFLAATLGAIAGDGVSYLIGYTFSERLTTLWPFKRYPNWLHYGKEYFAHHGATSVLLGRFVGPLRSIIPVIAGMMRMSHWKFFLANTLSAIGWAILYVMPGVLIGAASNELSTDSATHLFISILVLLAVIWLSSMLLKWLFIHTNQFLNHHLNHGWTRLLKRHTLGHYAQMITPKTEQQHASTAKLIVWVICCFFSALFIIALLPHEAWLVTINKPVFLFLQSLRTQYFDIFFMIINLFINTWSLGALAFSMILYSCYYRHWRLMKYWISLCLTTSLLLFILQPLLNETIWNIKQTHLSLTFFTGYKLTLATAMISFLISYSGAYHRTKIALTFRIFLFFILILKGVASLYLGHGLFINRLLSYALGLTLGLIHWIGYRANTTKNQDTSSPIIFASTCLIFATILSCLCNLKKITHTHLPYLEQYVITEEVWWNQKHPLLPLYSTNRIGQSTGQFNIQYVGSIRVLEKTLQQHGWKRQSASFFYSLLMRAGNKKLPNKLPLMTPLYLNKKPNLIMGYPTSNQKSLFILRLWRSNYHVSQHIDPIWLGSIQRYDVNAAQPATTSLQQPLLEALSHFQYHTVQLSHSKPRTHHELPILLILDAPKPP